MDRLKRKRVTDPYRLFAVALLKDAAESAQKGNYLDLFWLESEGVGIAEVLDMDLYAIADFAEDVLKCPPTMTP